MIKVLVPETSGDRERQESHSSWVPARPYVLSNYSIYPVGGIIDLGSSAVISRGRGNWRDPVLDTNQVRIEEYGTTIVLVNGYRFGKSDFDYKELGRGISAQKYSGITYLSILENAEDCLLTVVRGGKTVSEAKLIVVSGIEADRIIREEQETDARAFNGVLSGTSDFS